MTEHLHDPISEPLNRWLDGHVQGRSGLPATGDVDLGAVRSAALSFHQIARAGERYAAAQAPKATRWEDIMHAALPENTLPATGTIRSQGSKPPRGVLRFMPGFGDMGTMAAILAVMVLVGAVFSNLAPQEDGPGTDLALVPGPSVATPATENAWLMPVDPAECTVEPRSLDEIGAIMRDPGEWPERQYLPASPADPADAAAAAEVYRMWSACYLDVQPNAKRSVETPRYISEIAEYRYLDYTNFNSFDEWVAANEALRLAFAPEDPGTLFQYSDALQPLDETDPNVVYPEYWQSYSSVVEPRFVQILPDGRLVGLVTNLFSENSDTPMTYYPDGPWSADLIFFAPDPTRDGAWAVDQRVSICLNNCDTYYEAIDNDLMVTWSATPVPATPDATALPPATPEATPEG